jgi:gamma-glutamyl-gamma-aminobutyrate hydrolase PuuD
MISVTMSGLIATILGLVFTPDESSEILKLVDQLLIVGGIAATYYGRYRQGDITWFGTKN